MLPEDVTEGVLISGAPDQRHRITKRQAPERHRRDDGHAVTGAANMATEEFLPGDAGQRQGSASGDACASPSLAVRSILWFSFGLISLC